MVAHIHPVLSHALIGPLIQVDEEGDGVFLPTSHYRYAKVVRVKITHVHDGRFPLVEGPLVANECPRSFLIKSRHILRTTGPLHRLDVRAKKQPIEGPSGTSTAKQAHDGTASIALANEASADASSKRGNSPGGASFSSAAQEAS